MNRNRRTATLLTGLVLLAVLAAGALASPSTARAATSVSVTQLGRPIGGGNYVYARSEVRVYGPRGYYRSAWFSARTNRSSYQRVMLMNGVPEGPYRVSCDWYNINGFFMAQDNRYTNWASTNRLGQYWSIGFYSR